MVTYTRNYVGFNVRGASYVARTGLYSFTLANDPSPAPVVYSVLYSNLLLNAPTTISLGAVPAVRDGRIMIKVSACGSTASGQKVPVFNNSTMEMLWQGMGSDNVTYQSYSVYRAKVVAYAVATGKLTLDLEYVDSVTGHITYSGNKVVDWAGGQDVCNFFPTAAAPNPSANYTWSAYVQNGATFDAGIAQQGKWPDALGDASDARLAARLAKSAKPK